MTNWGVGEVGVGRSSADSDELFEGEQKWGTGLDRSNFVSDELGRSPFSPELLLGFTCLVGIVAGWNW